MDNLTSVQNSLTFTLHDKQYTIITSSSSSFRVRTLTRLEGLANWSSSICLSNETFGPRLFTFTFFAFPIFTVYSKQQNIVLHFKIPGCVALIRTHSYNTFQNKCIDPTPRLQTHTHKTHYHLWLQWGQLQKLNVAKALKHNFPLICKQLLLFLWSILKMFCYKYGKEKTHCIKICALRNKYFK